MKKFIFILFFVLFPCLFVNAEKLKFLQTWQENGKNHFQILVPVDVNSKMAVFKHNKYTYFVFSTSSKIKIDDSSFKDLPLVLLPHPSVLVLRGVFPEDLYPHLTLNEGNLKIEMRSTFPQKKMSLGTKWYLDGLLVKLKNAEVVELTDPNTKENLILFLIPFSPVFISERYEMSEMIFLPTYQGIAIYPKTESLEIKKNDDGFTLVPKNELSFSPMLKTQEDVISLAYYAQYSEEELKNELQELKSFRPYVSDFVKNKIFLEMAKINLALGNVEKALEILDILPESQEKKIYQFISYIQQNKSDKALLVFEKIKNPIESIHLWKNIIDEEPLYQIDEFEKVFIPKKLQFHFLYHLGLKSIKQKNKTMLLFVLEKMKMLSLTSYQKQFFLYLQAKLAQISDNIPQAIQIYEKIPFNPVSAITADILFSKVHLKLGIKQINTDTAITELEKIRPLIVSKIQEIKILSYISHLYYLKNKNLQALRIDRKLLSITKDINVLKRMRNRFEYFFITHKNKQPFEHAALYLEFKELIPSGIKGLQIKQHLLYDFLTLNLLEEAFDIAMQIVLSSKGSLQEESSIQAYLIAKILNDENKIKESQIYLPKNWIEKEISDNWHPILKEVIKKQ